jgi:hypothetical protein
MLLSMIAMIDVFQTNSRHSWIILETLRVSEGFVICIGPRLGPDLMIRGQGLSNFRLWEGLSAVRACGIVGVEVLTA